MTKICIATERAPGAIGPYSQGILAGGLIFVSGQLPLDAETGELEPLDIGRAAALSLENVRAILEACGSSMEKVVKTTVFLTDLSDFARVNEVYASFFGKTPPARSCVQVSALPRGARVEIEAVALQ